jgi:aromatic ring hydroxylase
MGIRTGQQYRKGLVDGRAVYANGERVPDVTRYPPFQGIIETLAGLYDAQHDPRHIETMTYLCPSMADRVSTTLMPARSTEEMQARVQCDYLRTDLTYGVMGRIPDFVNAFLLDAAGSLEFMGKTDALAKLTDYLDMLRDLDLASTHALIDPQSDRSRADTPMEAVQIIAESTEGVTVRGARMLSTLAPVSDEILIGPFLPRQPGEERYAVSFAVPADTPGLKIVCREPYDTGAPAFDRPLTSRFEEGDAVLIFDDVLVPRDRLFIAGDVDAYNGMVAHFPGFTGLQASIRGTAKLRFLTGLAAVVARANGRNRSSRHQEEIGELVAYIGVAEGLIQGAALDCANRIQARAGLRPPPGPGQPGGNMPVGLTAIMVFFPQVLTRAVEVVRMVAGSGVIAMTEQDLHHPELTGLLDSLMHGPDFPAERRLQVMRMAWDATGGQFGSRQALYERLYAGDPVGNRVRFFGMPRRSECEEMVERLLDS